MSKISAPDAATGSRRGSSSPPARLKLAAALRRLLRTKDFNSITTSEISRIAGANEALIYRYFKDKRGLLHQVLYDYLMEFSNEIREAVPVFPDVLSKLKHMIHAHIRMYDRNRVFARILLLEVRNFPAYFQSDTYRLVKEYVKLLTAIIKEGVTSGEIRDDIPVSGIRDLILGGIEHFVIAEVIFNHDMQVESKAEHLCKLIFAGIQNPKGAASRPQPMQPG